MACGAWECSSWHSRSPRQPAAQSFLGSIRGTVVDSPGRRRRQGRGARHRRGDGRPAHARDRRARAATRPRTSSPGTYRVEVAHHELQEVREDGRPRPRRRHGAGGRRARSRRRERDRHGLRPRRSTTSRSTARRSRAGSTSSSSTTCRATAATSSRSCCSTRTSSAAADDIQFLGAKTYGVSYIQDGQASTNAIFGTVGNSAPGLDAVEETAGALELVQRRVRRPRRRRRHDQARQQRITAAPAFFDFNSDGLNALTYNQTLAGVERGDPLADTHEQRWGGSYRRAARRRQAVLLRELRRLERQGDLRRRPGDACRRRRCAPATSAARRSRRRTR